MTLTITFPDLETKVGPKGYEHGWIFVGAPGVGDAVRHPHHGGGIVTHATDTHVHVKFGSGTREFERVKGTTGPGKLAERGSVSGAHAASRLTIAKDPRADAKDMSTGDLRAADTEFARRATALGHHGQVSKAHQAVRGELATRGGDGAADPGDLAGHAAAVRQEAAAVRGIGPSPHFTHAADQLDTAAGHFDAGREYDGQRALAKARDNLHTAMTAAPGYGAGSHKGRVEDLSRMIATRHSTTDPADPESATRVHYMRTTDASGRPAWHVIHGDEGADEARVAAAGRLDLAEGEHADLSAAPAAARDLHQHALDHGWDVSTYPFMSGGEADDYDADGKPAPNRVIGHTITAANPETGQHIEQSWTGSKRSRTQQQPYREAWQAISSHPRPQHATEHGRPDPADTPAGRAEIRREAGDANASAQARMMAVAQAGRTHFSESTGMGLPTTGDIKPLHSSGEVHEALGHLAAGRYAEADDAFSRAYDREVDMHSQPALQAAQRIQVTRQKVNRATADAKPVDPPLARLGAGDQPGDIRAVDHLGREYNLHIGPDEAGQQVVGVTHEGRTIEAAAGADPTVIARRLAGELTGPKRGGQGTSGADAQAARERLAGDVEQTASQIDTDPGGDAAQRALVVQASLRNAGTALRAGNHGEAFAQLAEAGRNVPRISGTSVITTRDGTPASEAVQRHMTSVLAMGKAPEPGQLHSEAHTVRGRTVQIQQTEKGTHKITLDGRTYIGTGKTLEGARGIVAKRFSGASAVESDAKAQKAHNKIADQIDESASRISLNDSGSHAGSIKGAMHRAATHLRAGSSYQAGKELADAHQRYMFAAQRGRGHGGASVRQAGGGSLGPELITRHIRALAK